MKTPIWLKIRFIVLLLACCSSSPLPSTEQGFTNSQPSHCFDVRYESGKTLEVSRLCFRYRNHCAVGRKGALKYGHWGGAVAVSMCWHEVAP